MTMPKAIRRWFLLLTVLAACLSIAHAYPTYMLSESGCLIDLDNTEVVMNALIKTADETNDPSMHIAVQDHSVIDKNRLSISPKEAEELSLTLVSRQTVDHHYVMESLTPEVCFFQGGACESQRRIAGRNHEYVKLQLMENYFHESNKDAICQLTAGWATGQEAVQLVPTLSIQPSQQQVKNQNQAPTQPNDNNVKSEGRTETSKDDAWFDKLLLDDCSSGIENNPNIQLVEDEALIPKADLGAKYQGGDTFALTITTGDGGSINDSAMMMVLETSPGAVFVNNNNNNGSNKEASATFCKGKRTKVVMSNETTGHPIVVNLKVLEERNIYVSGVYCYGYDSTKTLYRTKRLELEWNNNSEDKEKSHNNIQHNDNADGRQKAAADPQKAHDEQARVDRVAEQARKWRNHDNHDNNNNGHNRQQQRKSDSKEALIDFGPEYHLAALFMVFGTFIAIQCCLTVTGKDKGARDL